MRVVFALITPFQVTDPARMRGCLSSTQFVDCASAAQTAYRPCLIRAVAALGCWLFMSAAMASDPWSRADVERQIAWSTFQAIDWLQTRYIATHPQQFDELNPLLGKHPSLSYVNWVFSGAILATPIVVNELPARWRPWLQWPGLVFEGALAGHNAAIGIRLEF